MCGIGGILRTDGKPIPEEWLDAIDARIAYRGPDGRGRFRDRVEIEAPDGGKTIEVALIHRRLSIIDHAGGAQPMVSERGRSESEGLVAVVFNGCIYNHRELREELQEAGHAFVSDHSDTEVLIHGWRQWQEKLIAHLEGMYAFAIWDRGAGILAHARDWFGQKPLNLWSVPSHAEPAVLALASAPQPLLDLPAECPPSAPRTPGDFVHEYLCAGYETGLCGAEDASVAPATPGSLVTRGAVHLEHVARPESWGSAEVWPDSTLEALIDQAVQRRLEADVPLGCFLSGGIDSPLIAHFAKKHVSDLRTFTVRMPDSRYDESDAAEAVARHLGTNHTTLDVQVNPSADLVHLIETLGRPLGDSSILPTYWVSKAAREHVKVALSGDGGDEMFLGYERSMAAPLLARHHRWLRLLPSGLLDRFHPKSILHKLGRLGVMARDFPTLGLAAMESIFSLAQIKALTGVEYDPVWRCEVEVDARSSLREYDLFWYLQYDLLVKVDTASMACALEVRCPFLDRDLARAVLALPSDHLTPGGQRKGLLREIARKHLPAEIVDRPKMGFAIPIGEWFRSDWGGMRTLLLDHLESAEPFGPIELSRPAVRRFIDEHLSGKRDHGQRLFALLTLSIWARSRPACTPPAPPVP